jgi:hypothetical protein
MTYTLGTWADSFLHDIGNTHPTAYIRDYMGAWMRFEIGDAVTFAEYNPLNTTESNPRFGGFQGPNIQGAARADGVRDFPSFDQGVAANVFVLKNGRYSHLLAALSSNNEQSLRAATSGIASDLDTWGTKHAAEIAAEALTLPADFLTKEIAGDGPSGVPLPAPAPADVDSATVASFEALLSNLKANNMHASQLLMQLDALIRSALEGGQP